MVDESNIDQLEKLESLQSEVIHLRDRERILLSKLDARNKKIHLIYSHPMAFAFARIYHRYIKRDEKNV